MWQLIRGQHGYERRDMTLIDWVETCYQFVLRVIVFVIDSFVVCVLCYRGHQDRRHRRRRRRRRRRQRRRHIRVRHECLA